MLSRLMTRKEQFVLTIGAVAVITGVVTLYVLKSPSTSTGVTFVDSPALPIRTPVALPLPLEPAPSRVPIDVPEAKPMIAVSVVGAIETPDVYRLTGDPRIEDLLRAAGGLIEGANMSDINRAARLIDGTTLSIPYLPGTGPGGDVRRRSKGKPLNPAQYTLSGWSVGSSPRRAPGAATTPTPPSRGGGKINVNTASQQELESLPNIGPVYAAAIIEYRLRQPFQSIDELENVSGIGKKRLEALRNLVRVR